MVTAMNPDELIFARGVERAKILVRMLAAPDPRVQLAAAQVIDECADRVTRLVEEIARREMEEEDLAAQHDA